VSREDRAGEVSNRRRTAATIAVVDPGHRPTNRVFARQVALIKREIDACDERDLEDLLVDLFWTAWPTVWSQDQ
jgi:hypothetical protein